MTARQQEIIKIALIYANANLQDIAEAFLETEETGIGYLGGQKVKLPTEDEIDALLKSFQ